MDKKLLIVRFSSFGDIIHCRGQLGILKDQQAFQKIDWLVRKDLQGALEGEGKLDQILPFDRKEGLLGLVSLALSLRNEYDLVYDAHNNLRSVIFRFFLCLFSRSQLVVRPKNRWKRFLLFKFGINKFSWPFKAMESYWQPLSDYLKIKGELKPREWKVEPPDEVKSLLKDRIVLVPATAWKMKSWPVEHWKKLVELLPEKKFLILGGPQDHFCEDIKSVAPERVENLAGKYSLKESCAIAAHADFIISADTGLQQVADLAGVKGISLIGPSAFGFTTMGTMETVSVDLPCRPCSKDGSGSCSRDIYQECMVKITPDSIAKRCQVEFG